MVNVNDGQCGTCSHFGAELPSEQLVQIRISQEASVETVGGCGLPSNASVHLMVSANSSCDGYVAAA